MDHNGCITKLDYFLIMDHNGISIWLGSILVYESNDIYLKIIGIFLRILRGDPHETSCLDPMIFPWNGLIYRPCLFGDIPSSKHSLVNK